ncbi:uncharacterized protein LOC124916684 [Impatiens glandulifera]|uniref:uncharacterized protein LOC124916684 n=1 Tax=Impatiens glandulifera TaxID=253017 RepID=UPI001FB198AA|nr:uncharacterized protein LOC124916684 [Impatiens glandulifera]
MSSRQRRPFTRATKKKKKQTKSRSEKQYRGFCRAQKNCTRTTVGGGACTTISDKLTALKSLIPIQDTEILKSDQLFQETANYIVRLKAQVFVLQKLVDFYGSNDADAALSK